MSQTIFNTIVPSTTSGSQLATYLNDFRDAIVSGFTGTSRPTNLQAGGYWIDTTSATSWVWKVYDGTDDISLFTIDVTNNVAGFSNADSTFTVTKISADSVSPVLSLLKKRIASSGQVQSGDYVGTIEFKGVDNGATAYVTARLRGAASENYTGSALGTDLIFEATQAGTAIISEVMRIKDLKLGIGTVTPDSKVHAVGDATIADIKSEKHANDTTAAKFITKKKKATGTGQTLSGDAVGALEVHSTDDTGANLTAAKIEVQATQNHSTTAHGSKIVLSTKSTGATSLTDKLSVGDSIIGSVPMELPEVVDSTTTGASQTITPTKSVFKVTNASLTSINMIASPADGKIVILINGTGSAISLIHNTGATTANRIMTPTAADVTLPNNSGAILVYDSGSSKWILIDDPSVTSRLLATPSITGATTFAQATTPSSPASGSNKFYFKSGDKAYTLNSAGTEDAIVTEAGTQTLTNKTLTTPQVNAAAVIQNITTPTNPSAGFVKLYSKSDNLLYVLNSSGTESVVTLAGANSTLSNLTSPTAINQNLLPASTQTIGSSASPWTAAHAKALTLYGATSGNLGVAPSATTTTHSYVLPAAQGAASTYLKNDGSGNLSWSAVSGGSGVTTIAHGGTLSGTYDGLVILAGSATVSADTIINGNLISSTTYGILTCNFNLTVRGSCYLYHVITSSPASQKVITIEGDFYSYLQTTGNGFFHDMSKINFMVHGNYYGPGFNANGTSLALVFAQNCYIDAPFADDYSTTTTYAINGAGLLSVGGNFICPAHSFLDNAAGTYVPVLSFNVGSCSIQGDFVGSGGYGGSTLEILGDCFMAMPNGSLLGTGTAPGLLSNNGTGAVFIGGSIRTTHVNGCQFVFGAGIQLFIGGDVISQPTNDSFQFAAAGGGFIRLMGKIVTQTGAVTINSVGQSGVNGVQGGDIIVKGIDCSTLTVVADGGSATTGAGGAGGFITLSDVKAPNGSVSANGGSRTGTTGTAVAGPGGSITIQDCDLSLITARGGNDATTGHTAASCGTIVLRGYCTVATVTQTDGTATTATTVSKFCSFVGTINVGALTGPNRATFTYIGSDRTILKINSMSGKTVLRNGNATDTAAVDTTNIFSYSGSLWRKHASTPA